MVIIDGKPEVYDEGGTGSDVEGVLAQLGHGLRHIAGFMDEFGRMPALVAVHVHRWFNPQGGERVWFSYQAGMDGGGGGFKLREVECDLCHPELCEEG
jgi:hypothetical protein